MDKPKRTFKTLSPEESKKATAQNRYVKPPTAKKFMSEKEFKATASKKNTHINKATLESTKPMTTEEHLSKWLGDPMEKAYRISAEATGNTFNPITKKWEGSGEDPVDNLRHPMAGRYTSEAIQNKTGNVPVLSNVAGFLGANALGIAHEVANPNLGSPKDPYSKWDTVREAGEDIFNNAVGAFVGSTNSSSKDKDEVLFRLSSGNHIPDGYGRDKDNMYFKKEPQPPVQNTKNRLLKKSLTKLRKGLRYY